MTKKQKKQALFALLLLLILGGALAGVKIYNSKAEEKEAAEAEAEKIYADETKVDEITSISWQYYDDTIVLTKEDDTWVCEDHPDYDIDTDKVENLLGYLAPLEATDTVDEPEDLSVYGFDTPTEVITYETDEKSVTLTFGMENEFTSDYYLQTSLDDTIYLVGSDLFTAFDCNAESLTVDEETEE